MVTEDWGTLRVLSGLAVFFAVILVIGELPVVVIDALGTFEVVVVGAAFMETRVIGGEFPAAIEVFLLLLLACTLRACFPAAPPCVSLLTVLPFT